MSIADFTTGLTRSHAGLSGVLALADGRRAFAARAQLIEAAQHGIDCQYYIWRNDMSGQLLLDALRRAAQRGVRAEIFVADVPAADDACRAVHGERLVVHAAVEAREIREQAEDAPGAKPVRIEQPHLEVRQ